MEERFGFDGFIKEAEKNFSRADGVTYEEERHFLRRAFLSLKSAMDVVEDRISKNIRDEIDNDNTL